MKHVAKLKRDGQIGAINLSEYNYLLDVVFDIECDTHDMITLWYSNEKLCIHKSRVQIYNSQTPLGIPLSNGLNAVSFNYRNAETYPPMGKWVLIICASKNYKHITWYDLMKYELGNRTLVDNIIAWVH